MFEPTSKAKEYAHRLLIMTGHFVRRAQDGNEASEEHLTSLLEGLVELLEEMGGFGEVIRDHVESER